MKETDKEQLIRLISTTGVEKCDSRKRFLDRAGKAMLENNKNEIKCCVRSLLAVQFRSDYENNS
jgi:hypothetical protein